MLKRDREQQKQKKTVGSKRSNYVKRGPHVTDKAARRAKKE